MSLWRDIMKVLDTLKPQKNRCSLVIGTHNGIFHVDDVFACATLCLYYYLLYSNVPIQILRTRKNDLLMQCSICVDIGGGKYDHHQLGFDKKRTNGIKFASAGLVWNDYGRVLIELVLKKHFPDIKCDIDFVFKTFDENFIVPVDQEDNGQQKDLHCFSYITSFLPLWFNNNTRAFDKQFKKVLDVTIKVLEQKLIETINGDILGEVYNNNRIKLQSLKSEFGKKMGKKVLIHRYHNRYFHDGVLEIPSQTIDWKETVLEINSNMSDKVNFVIFPYPDGGWAAQCVPPSIEEELSQRIPFPAEWAGQTSNLSEISGVGGAILCHNYRFFARATDKESIIQMCGIATSLYGNPEMQKS